MPPSASWNGERCLSTAPVKAPRSCPKSVASASVGGIEPQSTTTKGLRARGLARCIAWATSSFPVPVSPVMRRVRSVEATLTRRSKMARMEGLCATMGPNDETDDTAMRSGRTGSKTISVSPMRSLVAVARKISPTRTPPTKVPLRLPRSRTRTPCSVATSSAWTALTLPSSSTSLQAALRPTMTGSVPTSTQAAPAPPTFFAGLMRPPRTSTLFFPATVASSTTDT